MIQPFILATAGHVDHGKSSLVKALTGTDPDRLPEEKARGITIDLGFAHLVLPNPRHNPASDAAPNPSHFSCGIVDVPGHEDFVKNMVAGVGAVDLALLVVAADDGWMPQTEEHLQILTYLGVTRAVIALTKADIATDLEDRKAQIRERLAESPFALAPIVPTSVTHLQGLESLKETLAETLVTTPRPADLGKPRLAVDRVFVLNGIGTIVTGTLTGGSLARGDHVVIQPSGRASRIRSCQSHGRDVDQVAPGTRAALNLADIAATEISRGDVITLPSLGSPSALLDTWTLRSPRLSSSPTLARRPLTRGTPIRFHLGATQVSGRIHPLECESLQPAQQGLAQIRLDEPVFAFAGDHFLLRDTTGRATIAGGVVLDPDAGRLHARTTDRLVALRACADHRQEPDPFLEASVRRFGCLPRAGLLTQSRFSAPSVDQAVMRLAEQKHIVRTETHIASSDFWSKQLAAMAEAIDQHHRQFPAETGLPVGDLRALLERQHGPLDCFEALIASLLPTGFQLDAPRIRRANHRPALPPELAAAGRDIRTRLLAHPWDPPPRTVLAADALSQQALRLLIRNGDLVELGPDIVLAREAFERARRMILLHLRRQTRATASELRQLLQTTRRILIPLLERLDRDGLTVREGEFRRLRTPPSS